MSVIPWGLIGWQSKLIPINEDGAIPQRYFIPSEPVKPLYDAGILDEASYRRFKNQPSILYTGSNRLISRSPM